MSDLSPEEEREQNEKIARWVEPKARILHDPDHCDEVYVKMCEKATEIQQQAPEMLEQDDKEYWYPECYALSHTWLPRQDQLQEMLRGSNGILRFPQLATAFSHWLDTNKYLELMPPVSFGGRDFPEATSCPFSSMEQLWLAFVMKEKYGKVWNREKEEWVK